MSEKQESIIIDRIKDLETGNYSPSNAIESLKKLSEKINNEEAQELLNKIQASWNEEMLEAFNCIKKLQDTINGYEDELVLMMDQMDALVKCSVLIKQYSLYLKEEVDKIADKIDKEGLDSRIDQLVDLLEEIKPKKHLNVVRETSVLQFPKKD
ncbi:MAG: hypothetical protein AB7V50_05515 [Vampirovibrionia bacterium]